MIAPRDFKWHIFYNLSNFEKRLEKTILIRSMSTISDVKRGQAYKTIGGGEEGLGMIPKEKEKLWISSMYWAILGHLEVYFYLNFEKPESRGGWRPALWIGTTVFFSPPPPSYANDQ